MAELSRLIGGASRFILRASPFAEQAYQNWAGRQRLHRPNQLFHRPNQPLCRTSISKLGGPTAASAEPAVSSPEPAPFASAEPAPFASVEPAVPSAEPAPFFPIQSGKAGYGQWLVHGRELVQELINRKDETPCAPRRVGLLAIADDDAEQTWATSVLPYQIRQVRHGPKAQLQTCIRHVCQNAPPQLPEPSCWTEHAGEIQSCLFPAAADMCLIAGPAPCIMNLGSMW